MYIVRLRACWVNDPRQQNIEPRSPSHFVAILMGGEIVPVILGGPNSRSQRVSRGGIVVSMQYVQGEPAMILFPLRKRHKQAAFIICLSAAWKYADDDYLAQQAKVAAEVLNMGLDRFTVYNIARAINDSLEDLVKMKPEPVEKPQVIGEGQLLGADSKPINFELTDQFLKH